MIEKDLENKIKTLLKLKDIFYVKIHGSQFQSSGISDLLINFKGMFLAVEVKVGPNKLTKLQKAQALKCMRQLEYSFVVVDQFNIDEFLEAVKELDYARIVRLSKESTRKYEIV